MQIGVTIRELVLILVQGNIAVFAKMDLLGNTATKVSHKAFKLTVFILDSSLISAGRDRSQIGIII